MDDNKYEIVNSSGIVKFIIKNLTIDDDNDLYRVVGDDFEQYIGIRIIDRKYCVKNL